METLRNSQTQQETQNLNEDPQLEKQQQAPMNTLLADWQQRSGLNEAPPKIEDEANEEEEDLSDLNLPPQPGPLPTPKELWDQFADAFSSYGQIIFPAELPVDIAELAGDAKAVEVADFYLKKIETFEHALFGLQSSESEHTLALAGIEIEVNDVDMDESDRMDPLANIPFDAMGSVTESHGYIDKSFGYEQLPERANGTVVNPGIGELEGDPIKFRAVHPETGRRYDVFVFCHFQIFPLDQKYVRP